MTVSAQSSPASDPASGVLGRSALLRHLPPERLQAFTQAARLKTYRKGKLLYQREEAATKLYFVQFGWVKLFRETLDGEEAISDIVTSGHVFGENALFNNNTYNESAEVVEDTSLLELPLHMLQEEIANNPAFAQAMLTEVMSQRRRLSLEVEHLSVQSTAQRIGCFMLRLCTGKDHSKPVVLHLPYDKLLLAARLGMQPETFSRALVKLRNDAGIAIKGATVTIPDIQRLVGYCCNACSSAYPCES